MIRKHATLLLQTLYCDRQAGDPGKGNELYIIVDVDGSKTRYPSGNDVWHMASGNAASVDIEVEDITYLSVVEISLYEQDPAQDDFYGTQTIDRKSERDETNHGEIQWTGANSQFRMAYRVITDPIPTVRVLAIRCEQESAGMNQAVSDAVTGAASSACTAAGAVVMAVPIPGSDVLSLAFGAASWVLKGVNEFAQWMMDKIEGPDDVYIEHVAEYSTRGYGGSFFPPIEGSASTYPMSEGEEAHFEQKYGEYFRFPLDEGPVTIRFREHDAIKGDINLGTITIAPDELDEGENTGIGGTTCNGGVAKYDGPAVVEIADSYGERGGEGAVYQICYSVGTEDWCKPANAAGQGFPPSPPPSNWKKTPEVWVGGTATAPVLVSNGDGSFGLYQLESDYGATWIYTRYENGQWSGAEWSQWAFVAGLAALGGSERQTITCQISGTENSMLLSFEGMELENGITDLWLNQPSGLAVASWGPGRLDVFTTGTAKELLHYHSTDGGTTWDYFGTSHGGQMKDYPAAVSWGPNRIDVVVRGMDDKLWHIAWDGNQWTAWEGLGGQSINSAPTICSRGEGSLDVFARASNGKVLYRTFNDGAWAKDWTLLNSPPTDFTPAAAATGLSRLDVAIRGQDLQIYIATIDFDEYSKSAGPSRAAEAPEPAEETPEPPAEAPERKNMTFRYATSAKDGNRTIHSASFAEVCELRQKMLSKVSQQDED